MFSKLWLINGILLIMVVFLGIRNYDVWVRHAYLPLLSQEQDLKALPPSRAEKKLVRVTLPPESAYEDVAGKNLFAPDRKEMIPKAPEPESKPEAETAELKAPDDKIVLYGVILMDDYQAALLSDPERKPNERQSRWVKVGDKLSGYDIAAIKKDQVLLGGGGKEYVVPLHDKKRTGSPPTVRESDEPTVITTTSSSEITTTSRSDSPENAAAAPTATASKPAAAENAEEEKYQIIDTPFGKIKRRIK